MSRFAIVNDKNEVVNVIVWEGAEFLPPRGHSVIKDDGVDVHDLYDPQAKKFTKALKSVPDAVHNAVDAKVGVKIKALTQGKESFTAQEVQDMVRRIIAEESASIAEVHANKPENKERQV